MNSIEVCVVAYANIATIEECVDSARLVGPSVSVALADNHPAQDSIAAASAAAHEAGLPFRAIARPDNPGFAVACNALARSSQADWLLFLNPDAAIRSWPDAYMPTSGVTAPKIVGLDGRRQYIFGRRRNVLDEITRRLQIRPRDPDGVGYVSGAALLVQRDEFLAAGGFDERYFMYYEDIDLCRTIVEQGGSVRIDPELVVQHIGGHSASSAPGAMAVRSYDSARSFYEKWTASTLGIDVVVLVDSALRVAAGRLGRPVPGTEGAKSTLPLAWGFVRDRLPFLRRGRMPSGQRRRSRRG